MEELLRCNQSALIIASDRLIDLVDHVIERHPRKAKRIPRLKVFSWPA